MTNKTKIILLVSILVIFGIIMTIIIVNKPKEDIEETEEHNYAVNEVKEQTYEYPELEEETETIIEEQTLSIMDIQYEHLERLTPEQNADKNSMMTKLKQRYSNDEKKNNKVTNVEVLATSTKFRTDLECTFEDGSTEIYVCNYDPTCMHSYLRCVSLQEWDSIEAGDNAGDGGEQGR